MKKLALSLWIATVIALGFLSAPEAEYRFFSLLEKVGLRDKAPTWCQFGGDRDFEAALCIRMRWPDDMPVEEYEQMVNALEDRGYVGPYFGLIRYERIVRKPLVGN